MYHCRRNNLPASGDYDQMKEALLPEGGDGPRLKRTPIQKLNDNLDSADVVLEDEVNKWKFVMSHFTTVYCSKDHILNVFIS